MNKPLKLSHYTVDIYNAWHSTGGTLVTDKDGKIVACQDLNSCDGWNEDNSGSADEILDLVIEAANKAIAAGKVPAELPADSDDYIIVAEIEEWHGNCATILANYEEAEDDE